MVSVASPGLYTVFSLLPRKLRPFRCLNACSVSSGRGNVRKPNTSSDLPPAAVFVRTDASSTGTSNDATRARRSSAVACSGRFPTYS